MSTSAPHHRHGSYCDHDSDAALLDILTAPTLPTAKAFVRRDSALDPLLIAAAAASGPHVTRNHYHHDFFPGVMLPKSEGSWDWTKWSGDDAGKPERKRYAYVRVGKENDCPREPDPLKIVDNLPPSPKKRRQSLLSPNSSITPEGKTHSKPIPSPAPLPAHTTVTPAVEAKCMARTRVPTPHGSVFLHLYHNNRDNKEHLAVVVDPAQFNSNPGSVSAPPIRSRSLDAVWSDTETEMDRITRGAYVGRLGPTSQQASEPLSSQSAPTRIGDGIPPPLIRIHSECFTGETIGSMRCDCGEQLDEAIRLISQPITIPSKSPLFSPTTIPGRGAVVYLRQEGRGIGLLSKIRAYNLQDLGHDTVTANLMLGHKADERGYEIAIAILRDLGLGDSDVGSPGSGEGVRVLTNNPDKVQALEQEGLRVAERVPMIPRSWKTKQLPLASQVMPPLLSTQQEKEDTARIVGATMIGGNAVHGEDLDKYLRTKVLRMGHLLPLWMEGSEN
ncbi:cyclohydrolase [Infundibulicybe gibba]|nr:cyclohydrolase [Infundibulicybe gibba]